jgi:hypothetical protein
MKIRISDVVALWVGRLSLVALIVCVVGIIGLMYAESTMRESPARQVIIGVLLFTGFAAWSVAYFVMRWHQEQAWYMTSDDMRDWENRQDTKVGGIVPFVYLLAPKQRRISSYIGTKRRP